MDVHINQFMDRPTESTYFPNSNVSRWFTAVSYTHLDVYKRQEYNLVDADKISRDDITAQYNTAYEQSRAN